MLVVGDVTPGIVIVCAMALMHSARALPATGDQQTTAGVMQEFCQNEEFKATCAADDEVVVIGNATYGRMRTGRCVRRDYGYTGCSADVTSTVHALCSGKRSCTLRVPNAVLDDLTTCPDDFKNYLEVSYECIRVVTPRNQCSGFEHVLTSERGVLASVVTSETGCGSPQSPWLIQQPLGRRITLTLTDFLYGTTLSSASQSSSGNGGGGSNDISVKCVAYVIIKEPETGRTVTVCSEAAVRERQVYVSETNRLSVIVLATSLSQPLDGRNFLISYDSFGCVEPPPPENGWIEKHGDTVTMGCHQLHGGPSQGQSDTTWKLTCVQSRWTGTMGNCTHTQEARISSLVSSTNNFLVSLDLALVVVVSIAFIIACFILCVGLVYIKGRRRRLPRYDLPPMSKMAPLPAGYIDYPYIPYHYPANYPTASYPPDPYHQSQLSNKEPYETYHSSRSSNDYASIGENGLMGSTPGGGVNLRENPLSDISLGGGGLASRAPKSLPPVSGSGVIVDANQARFAFPPPPPPDPMTATLTSSFRCNGGRPQQSRIAVDLQQQLGRQQLSSGARGDFSDVIHVVVRNDPYAA